MRRLRLLALLLLLLASPAWAVIAKVQDAANVVVGTSAPMAFGSNVTAHNMLVACIHAGSGSGTIADSLHNTWTTGTPNADMAIFFASNSLPGSDTVTLTCGSSGNCGGVVAEISGMGTSPLQDGAGAEGTYNTRTVIQTSTVSTAGLNPELVIGCGFTDSVQTPTGLIDYGAGGGSPTAFTHQGQTSTGGGETLVGAFQSTSTTGPFGFQWTVTSSNTLGAIAAFKPNSPTFVLQSQCPNGAGVAGVCNYPTGTVATLSLEPCPTGTNCTATVRDQVPTCAPGTVPVGGGSNYCWTQWTGTAWLDF